MLDAKTLKFMKSHEWLNLDGDAGTVGISDHAQKEITDVVFIEPPKVGRTVKQGESCCVVESVKAAFDIYAPVSGTITAVNADAVTRPQHDLQLRVTLRPPGEEGDGIEAGRSRRGAVPQH